ncbi:MAG: hypothetical protein CMB80_15005 [Flammeovirgaceae bacterium]|nr:hypothetical protein [Flammeovirgaceae bacterium]
MGFLDHSTNNIIIDAVLTDIGREYLAKNDGSFSITKFALGDDEVDYTIIEKFGRTVGKEKIEKNTPVFEAQTSGNHALKYKLSSISNPIMTRMPTAVLSGVNLSGDTLTMTKAGAKSQTTLSLEQTIEGVDRIDHELVDSAYIVKLPSQFLQVKGTTYDTIDNNIASYVLTSTAVNDATRGAKLDLKLETKSITEAQFNVYGDSTSNPKISAVVSIVGVQSGTTKDINVLISKFS